jgi:hypothetical protein
MSRLRAALAAYVKLPYSNEHGHYSSTALGIADRCLASGVAMLASKFITGVRLASYYGCHPRPPRAVWDGLRRRTGLPGCCADDSSASEGS